MDTTAKTPTSKTHAGDKAGTAPEPQAKPPPDPIQAVVERARNGDASALPELEAILDSDPSIWRRCQDLVALTEQAWIDKITGSNLLLGQSIRRQLNDLRKTVAGPSPSPLEKLLADRIAASWLAVQHSELSETCSAGDGIKAGQLRLKRLESANRRFLSAVKSLAVVRRLTNGLRVEINHVHPAVPASDQPTGIPAARDNETRSRLNGLFKDGVAAERNLTSQVQT